MNNYYKQSFLKEVKVAKLSKGGVFGEEPLYFPEEKIRNQTAICCSNLLTVYEIPLKAFVKLI